MSQPQDFPHRRHGCNGTDLSACQALSRERSKLQWAGAGYPVRLQRGAGVNISPGPAQSEEAAAIRAGHVLAEQAGEEDQSCPAGEWLGVHLGNKPAALPGESCAGHSLCPPAAHLSRGWHCWYPEELQPMSPAPLGATAKLNTHRWTWGCLSLCSSVL